MTSLTLIFHGLMLVITSLIILTILILLFKNWKFFTSLDNYKLVVFLSSLAIAIGSHQIVYYNYIKTFNLPPKIY